MTNLYQEAIDTLTSQGKFYINLGLERCQKILKLIGNPEKKLKIIHVAGTNGKGSVCAMLGSILENSGLKTGLFTSPHVFEYTERIKINGEEISKEMFAQQMFNITQLAKTNDVHLTEFEILTVMAFEYFAQNNVDIVVLETGLGGRLDATNVIENNLCSIITHIDFDHTDRLGNTIEEISQEKAGIIKKDCPVVIGRNNVGYEVIKQAAQEKNAPLLTADETPNFSIDCLALKLALKGLWQRENLALVLTAIEILKKNNINVPQEAVEKGLKSVNHPCRFEYFKEKNILVDGAHNPNGALALRESINYYFPNKKIKFIFGCLKNKEYTKMMENLFVEKDKNLLQDEIYFYTFENENACSYEELSNACKFPSKPFADYKNEDSGDTLTVICGSFYMIKELLLKIDIK